MRRYKTEIIQYTTNINLTSNCNAIAFLNAGTSNAYIGKFTLTPGQGLEIDGNQEEIDTTTYVLEFDNNRGLMQVIRKFYI